MTWADFAPPHVFALRGENRGLLLAAWYNVVLLVLSLAALPFDHRRILGLNPWIKPVKFQISVIVFLLTLAVLLSALGRLGRWRRTRAWIGGSIALSLVLENTIIAAQSLRGVRSHMNYDTPLDGGLFALMGLLILVSTLMVVLTLVLYCITATGLPPALTWAIRLGLLVLLAGSAEGVLMVGRNAHVVGAADGVPGLPFVNWSTAHGDLRVAHFFALHALQVFVLAGWIIARTRITPRLQTAIVVAFAGLYCAGVWVLFTQAMRGQPVLPL